LLIENRRAGAEAFQSEIRNQQSTINNRQLKIENRKSEIGIQRNPAVRERVSPARR
jgi:hypothetical protein